MVFCKLIHQSCIKVSSNSSKLDRVVLNFGTIHLNWMWSVEPLQMLISLKMVLYCWLIICCMHLFDSAKSPSLFHDRRMLLKIGVDYSRCKFVFLILQMLQFIALWPSCFDLYSACFQIAFDCATGNMLLIHMCIMKKWASEKWQQIWQGY